MTAYDSHSQLIMTAYESNALSDYMYINNFFLFNPKLFQINCQFPLQSIILYREWKVASPLKGDPSAAASQVM